MSIKKFVNINILMVIFIAILPLFVVFTSRPAGAVVASGISIGELNSLSNQERASAGLAPLSLNSQLSSAAYAKANHMIANNYWAHVSPDGTTPWYFIMNAGYNYTAAGENLAKDFSTSGGVVAGWMASPGHRANVLGSYNDVGYAVVNGVLMGSSTTLVVAMYGAQSAPAPAPAPAPVTTTPTTTTPTTAAPTETAAPASSQSAPVTTTTGSAGASQPTDATKTAEAAQQPKTAVAANSKLQSDAKKSTKTINNGKVAGASTIAPIDAYKSLSSQLKSIILVVLIVSLVTAARFILMMRKNKHGIKYVWFKKQPVAGSGILVVLVVLTLFGGVGATL